MGRPRNEYPSDLISMHLSITFHDFLMRRRNSKNEPLYRVADRFMQIYKLSDKADLEEQTTKQAEVIKSYFQRIKELEKQITEAKEWRQTQLETI